MQKFLFIATAVLLLFSIFCFKWALNERDGRKLAESINKSNATEIGRLNKANDKATAQIQKLQNIEETIKEPCNCFNNSIPKPVLDVLRKRK